MHDTVLHYVVGAEPGSASAVLTHIDGDLPARIKVGDPFGFYVGELPPKARDITAEGMSSDGDRVWEASFQR